MQTKILNSITNTMHLIRRFVKILLIFILCFSFYPNSVNAASAGKSLYEKGNFQGAIQAYSRELKGEKGSQGRANILKMIGICQYNIGQSSAAKSSFQKAKKLSPHLTIQSNEVLDESVIGFFNSISSPAHKQVSKPQGEVALAPNAKSAKSTKLIVYSNASNATILIQGIMAGTVGTEIEVDPGKSQLTLNADGYKSAIANATIKPNRTNSFEINLKKISEKPKKSKPKVAKRKKTKRPKGNMFDDEPVKYQNPSGRDLTDEFASDATTQPQPQYVPPQQPGYPQPVYQQPGYQQPVYQQPVQQQPQYGPSPVVSNELYLDDIEPKEDKRTKPANHFITILPLGAGQFQNSSPVLGSLVAAAQIGAVTYWYINYQDAQKTIKDTNAFSEQRLKEEQTITDPTALTQHQADTDQYVTDSNAYIDGANQKANIGLIGLAVVYAAGVTEAFINEPAVVKPKRKSRRSRGFSFLNDYKIYEYGDEIEFKNLYNGKVIALEKSEADQIGLNIVPTFNDNSGKSNPGFAIHFHWRYK